MRSTITTKELAERFGKDHRSILHSIRGLMGAPLVDSMFTESSYMSVQNKEIKTFTMGLNGFSLLANGWGFSKGKSASVKAEILAEFGQSFTVISDGRNRFEDDYYLMLSSVFHKENIIREFGIGKYKVDFYMPDYNLIIEHDDESHLSKSARERDAKRELDIKKMVKENADEPIFFIRVAKGKEFPSLSRVAGFIALCGLNALDITKYYED